MALYDTNTDLVRGDEVFLYVGSSNTVLAFATSVSVQIDGETIDTSNKMSGKWASNISGKNSYSISSDALYTQASGATSFGALKAMMVAGTPVTWAIGLSDNTTSFALSDEICSGTGLITSLSLNAGNNEVASCSITITGTGALE